MEGIQRMCSRKVVTSWPHNHKHCPVLEEMADINCIKSFPIGGFFGFTTPLPCHFKNQLGGLLAHSIQMVKYPDGTLPIITPESSFLRLHWFWCWKTQEARVCSPKGGPGGASCFTVAHSTYDIFRHKSDKFLKLLTHRNLFTTQDIYIYISRVERERERGKHQFLLA